jgi:hypothetical protein
MKSLLLKGSGGSRLNRNIIKLSQRGFSEADSGDIKPSPDSGFKSLEEITYVDLKKYINQADTNIENGVLNLKAIPDNNYFGEIPVYICPTYTSHNVRPYELSSLTVPSILAFLSYHKIVFTSSFFFPFYSFIALISFVRLSTIRRSESTIMSISLLDENKVKIQFLNGKSIETGLKNIHISTGFMNNLNNMDDSKIARINKHNPQKNLLSTLLIYLTVENVRTCPLLLRSHNFTPGVLDKASLAYINNDLFYGVINKRTKKLALKDN